MAKRSSEDQDFLKEAQDEFDRIAEIENDNRENYADDIAFARHGEQWPEAIRKEREMDGRPCLTINRMNSFIRQVVNDSRQNKPSVKAKPVDDMADPETAKVLDGLFRNIEHISKADIAYDTAVENAVSGGFGYIRVNIDYADEDAFDLDILIERVANPLSVYGDPDSTGADGSDWEKAFIVDKYSKAQFERRWGDKSQVDWDDDAWSNAGSQWRDDESCMVAEYWHCTYEDRTRLMAVDTRDGSKHVYDKKDFEKSEDLMMLAQMGVLQILNERTSKAKRFQQAIMTGVEVLEKKDWPGRYIPIVPVYGDEYWIDGRRYLRSLIHPAKDAQRMYNFWRTNSTELVALAPRVPFIGRVGTFNSDSEKWASVNTKSHAYLEFDTEMPQRQPLDMGVAAGSLQEALNASDDMKSIIGMYDASLGARSNETSGKAIMARQREGDIATFHFTDNLTRAIRQTARIVLDLVPHVYNKERIIRVLGEDGSESTVKVNAPAPKMDKEGEPEKDDMGNVIMQLHDLTVGKYDIQCVAGPSFTTRREEAAMQMTEMVRAFPMAAPYVADIMAKNFDWPGADEIAERLEALNPLKAQENAGPPPEMLKMQAEMQSKQMDAQAKQASAQADMQAKAAELEMEKEKHAMEMERMRLQIEADRQKIITQQATFQQQQQNAQMSAQMERERNDGQIAATRQLGEIKRIEKGLPPQDMVLSEIAQSIAAGQQQIAQAMAQFAQVQAAPKRVVTDAQGNPIGVETVVN